MRTARVRVLGNSGSFKMRISEKEIDYWDTQEKWVEYEKFDPGCSAVQKSNIEPVPGVKLSVLERDSFCLISTRKMWGTRNHLN